MHTRWSTRRRTHSHYEHASSSAGSHLGPSEAGQLIGLSSREEEGNSEAKRRLPGPHPPKPGSTF